MWVDAKTIITAGSVLAATIAFITLAWRLFTWIDRQRRQDVAIQSIKEEQCLLTYGVLACLKGLAEQGCDGPVKDAIVKIEKHINQKAHSSE